MIRRFIVGFVAAFTLIPSAFGQVSAQMYQYIDQLVRQRNGNALRQTVQHYHSLDFTDVNGQTALCTAIRRNDYAGYVLLAQLGADRRHSCVQNMSMSEKQAFDQRYKTYMASLKYSTTPAGGSDWEISPVMWGVGGAVGIGAVVAAVAAGGGGGGSHHNTEVVSDSNNNSQTDPGNTTPKPSPSPTPSPTPTPTPTPTPNPTPSPTPNPGITLPASYFKTAEYMESHFLDTINAAGAYAKVYKGYKDSAGNMTIRHNLEDVKVGVIDGGVYPHNELKNHLLTGYNYDYGPCTSKHTTNCWKYKSSWFESGVVFVDSKGRSSDIIWNMSQADFNEWAAAYSSSYTWKANDTTPNATGPTVNHGTHVTGIISADKNNIGMHGVAPNAEIIPVKYDFLGGLSNPITTLVNNGARVINMSLGTSASSVFNASIAKNNRRDYADYLSMDLNGFKKVADSKSTVLVVAAGNESYTQPSLEAGAGLYYPELSKVMIVVVAVDPNTKTLASWSNQCGVTQNYCMAAPGVQVMSTVGNGNAIQAMSGTSMATPVVSGAAAFLMGAYPHLSAEKVTSLLFETATDLGDKAKYGHGLLNLEAAMNPVGTVSLATTAQVNGERVSLSGTQLAVPRAMSRVMKQLPAGVSVLDKYDRAFTVDTRALVHTNERDYRIFQNQLHRFSKFDSVHRLQEKDSPFSFGYSTASKKESVSGIGGMDVSWQFKDNKARFYYSEDTQYGNGEFFDRVKLNPFTAMEEAYGVENTYAFNKNLDFNFGFVSGKNALLKTDEDQMDEAGRLTAFQSGLTYHPIQKFTLQVMSGALQEQDSLLGLRGSGAFDVNSSRTYYVGMSAETTVWDKLRLNGAYYYGMTPAQKLNGYARTDRLYSESIAFDARWLVDSENYWGLFAVSPLRIKKGNALFRLPSGRDYYSDTVYFDTVKASMAAEKREWDFGLYGVYTYTPALRFKGQTGLRLHPEHQAQAKPDYQVLFGMDWRWN